MGNIMQKLKALPAMMMAQSKVANAQMTVLQLHKAGNITDAQAEAILGGFSLTVNVQTLHHHEETTNIETNNDNRIDICQSDVSSGAVVGHGSQRKF